MEKTTISKLGSIESIVADLNKELKMSVQIVGSSKGLDVKRLRTGSLTYDICTGGGFPIGRHTTLFGAESSGKTTSSLLGLVSYQKSGDPRYALMIDAELAFDKKYAQALGVDIDKLIIFQPDHLAEGHDVLMSLLRSDSIGYFIVDSIAALLPKSVLENEADASNIGKHAQAIGNMYKISNSYVGKQNVTAIWINQIRDSIGGYGGGISLPAGWASKFYSSLMIQVNRGSKEKMPDGTFVNKGMIRTTKNKTFPPYQEGEYVMEHGTGISVSQEVLDYGVASNTLYKKGHSFYHDATFVNDPEKNKEHVFLGKSKADAVEFLNTNLEFRQNLYDLILKAQFEE